MLDILDVLDMLDMLDLWRGSQNIEIIRNISLVCVCDSMWCRGYSLFVVVQWFSSLHSAKTAKTPCFPYLILPHLTSFASLPFPSVPPRCSVSASHSLRQLFIGALPRMPSLSLWKIPLEICGTSDLSTFINYACNCFLNSFKMLTQHCRGMATWSWIFLNHVFLNIHCPSILSAMWCLVFVIVWPASGQCRLLYQRQSRS